MQGIAGQPWRRGSVVYMNNADGLWYLADSDAVATMPTVGLATDTIAVAGQHSGIILVGLFGRRDWTWTRGDPLYVSGVAGVMTQTAPAANKQVIGVAITATMVYVMPMGAGVDLSMLDYEVQTGIIAEPTIPSKGNGHAVEVYNSTEDRTFLWLRCNADSDWMGVEVL